MHTQLHRILAASATALILACGATARADVPRCKAAIIKAGASFVQAKAKALHRCEESKVKGKLPPNTVCPTDVKTAAAITRASDKLTKSIASACGGKDKICGGSHAMDDESLASIGWDITTCPNFENGNCTNPIGSCGDIPICLACIGEAAVDQAITLYYGSLAPTDPRSKDKIVKALNKCQVTLGKSASDLLAAKSRALAKCWSTVNKTGAGSCPDAVASAAIATAESKKVAAIKKACQGADKLFGTADDFTPAQIESGFPPMCLDVTPPGGSSCRHAIGSLLDLIDCVACVTEFKVDCADRAAVPAFVAPYPEQCNTGVPTPTTTPAPTITSATNTPTNTLGGTPGPTSTPTISPTPSATPTFTFNKVFVTSAPHAANFGSASAADAVCQSAADAAGLTGTFVAWLSDANSTAVARLGSARGFVRIDGQPFADRVSDMTAGTIWHPLRIDEHGIPIDEAATTTTVWTGTNKDGTVGTDTCLNWTSVAGTDAGVSGRTEGGPVSWTDRTNGACSTTGRLYCFQTDFSAALAPSPASGKIAFYSTSGLTPAPGAGITAADTICTDEATAAGLQGSYKALIATSTTSAISRFPAASTSTYVRADGVVIASGATLALGDSLASGIWQHADGTYGANSNAWTGATTPSVAGTSASTCNDWASTSSTSGIGGPVTFADATWWNGFTNGDCTHAFKVYCLQE